MNRPEWLDFRLAVADVGWAKLAACALCIAAALLHWGVRAALDARTEALTKAANVNELAAAEQAPQEVTAERLQAFTNRLTESNRVGEALKTLFAEADKAGLTLAQADYQRLHDDAGDFSKFQISLPVKAPYPKLRAFVRNVLAALPGLSIDEIGLRRESIGSQPVDARIRMTLYLRSDE